MSAIGISLDLTGDGDRAALHDAISGIVYDFIHHYVDDEPYPGADDYRMECVSGSEEGVTDGYFGWWFDNPGGCCSRSSHLWYHWFDLALATEWDRVVVAAKARGLTVTSARPDLSAVLDGPDRFVGLRGSLWSVAEDGLFGDDAHTPVEKLTEQERARLTVAVGRCQCPLCPRLRLDAEVAEDLFARLDAPETAPLAAWHLSRARHLTFETLTALLRADAAMDTMEDAVRQYVSRLPDAWPKLRQLLPSLRGRARGLALYALEALSYAEPGRRAELLGEARSALTGTDEAAVAAVAVLGRLGDDEPWVVEELCGVLDRDGTGLLHSQAVVALANLQHRPGCSLDPEVRARFEREIGRDSPAGRIAALFLPAPEPS
ncbi:hypothetical protein [Streptomyces hainanensis]|uniref:HEAT repeat domain-containing protein n=1 Tax=Streptomyces hainanensis TaxID=402648 RepID=A0A4R4TH37_9ACTN|nr:hypothetical protein [Streptomyces hainanensis]TDC77068.1 hypothetical protein E1283_08220 [Streptomyces hainanensis]